jgi:putative PIN family toxin of toxin-antitoxin system
MPRPSVVLDTNVVVSAHLRSDGLERFVLDLALAGAIKLYMSHEILEEYSGVLRRARLGISPDLVADSLDLVRKVAKFVRPKQTLSISSDSDDNKFLECAEETGADYLVTGNKRHFPKAWGRTRVVSARELLEEIIPTLKS